MTDKEILSHYGWRLLCATPLEIDHPATDSFAEGEAAEIVIEHLRNRKEAENLHKIFCGK